MTLTYHYKKLPGKKGSQIKTPSIPVTFKGRSSLRLGGIALVDSGADISVIPKGFAELLDLDLSGKENPSYGLSGKVIKCIESKIKVIFGTSHEKQEFWMPVLVSPNDNCPLILGRDGFFDKFKIAFNGRNEILTIKPITKIIK